MLRRESYLGALVLAACAAAASGAIYTWSGWAAGNSDFTDPDNWCDSDPCGTSYPDGNDDDALFPVRPYSNGSWGAVNLNFSGGLTIDDMTIKDGVEFKGHGGEPHLTVSTLTIDATDDDILVTFSGKIALTANPEGP
jgi:hypothetical protein